MMRRRFMSRMANSIFRAATAISAALIGIACLATPVYAAPVTINGNWTLQRNEVIADKLNFNAGTLNLNGYRLDVAGDLIQSGGILDAHGGILAVAGNYRIQTETVSGSTTHIWSESRLSQNAERGGPGGGGRELCHRILLRSHTSLNRRYHDGEGRLHTEVRRQLLHQLQGERNTQGRPGWNQPADGLFR